MSFCMMIYIYTHVLIAQGLTRWHLKSYIRVHNANQHLLISDVQIIGKSRGNNTAEDDR